MEYVCPVNHLVALPVYSTYNILGNIRHPLPTHARIGSIMQTKLTLRLDEDLIHRAKHYAAGQDRSLSQLVADYFVHLAVEPAAAEKAKLRGVTTRPALGPITTALHGALGAPAAKASLKTLASRPKNRGDYRAYLEDKHR